MADYSLITKQKLIHIMKKMSRSSDSYVKRPGKDFSRSRKISFFDTLRFLLSLGAKSLDKELLDFFSYRPDLPTSSAMLQQRGKLKPNTMKVLFSVFTASLPKHSNFHGYHLLAADGSELSFPENKKEPLCHRKIPNTQKGKNAIHLNALYHLNSGIFDQVLFQPVHEKDEHSALITMLAQTEISSKVILTADRGYESYNTFAHILEKGWNFVIRGRQGDRGILSSLAIPDQEQFDVEYPVVICKKHCRGTKEQPEFYKRIRSGAKFDFFTEEQTEYPMKLRVIKWKVSEDLSEILFTNLSKEEMPVGMLQELYRMRWMIETAFSQLKYNLGASALHSKRIEYVLQELYAKVIMFNYCKSILFHISLPQKTSWKYDYQISLSTAVDICLKSWRCPNGTAPPDVEILLLKYKVPIRRERSFPRTLSPKAVIYFTYRIA